MVQVILTDTETQTDIENLTDHIHTLTEIQTDIVVMTETDVQEKDGGHGLVTETDTLIGTELGKL